MPELWTTSLTAEQLKGILDRFQQYKSFKEVRDSSSEYAVSTTRLSAFDISPYAVNDILGIQVEHTFSPLVQSEAMAAWQKVQGLQAAMVCRVSSISFQIAESRQQFDPEEDNDLAISLYKGGRHGKSIGVAIGAISPGSKDLKHRQNVYNNVLSVLGLEGRVRAVDAGTGFDVVSSDSNICVLAAGQLEPSSGSLLVKKATDQNGHNPNMLGIYRYAGELYDACHNILKEYQDRIARCALSIHTTKDKYSKAIGSLEELKLDRWRIVFTADNRFRLAKLDKVIGQVQDFLIRAFTINPPKLGQVDVDISKSGSDFRLRFYTDALNADKVLAALLTEISGRDIVDHEPL